MAAGNGIEENNNNKGQSGIEVIFDVVDVDVRATKLKWGVKQWVMIKIKNVILYTVLNKCTSAPNITQDTENI